jgi:hypothetical protein
MALKGKPVACLDAEGCLDFLLHAAQFPDALLHLETALGAGLDLRQEKSGFFPLSFCLSRAQAIFEGPHSTVEGGVFFDRWMDIATLLVLSTGCVVGSNTGKDPLHALPDCLNEYEAGLGYRKACALLSAMASAVSPQNLLLALKKVDNEGQTPLQALLFRWANPLVPGFLQLYQKANLAPPWEQIFDWMGGLDPEDIYPLEPGPVEMLDLVTAMGAPIWGDDQVEPLGVFVREGSPLGPLLALKEQARLDQLLKTDGESFPTKTPPRL